ncbi:MULTISPECIES: fimbrial protein [Serratia]|uniref:fimbrial protein n=1 Tax=Serratia TaxID=613 RepID=UPI0007455392|nr:fimbrial protein [Serratia marcescens]MDS0825177.1 fimbrial protein [Serratia marcescens]MDX7571983.1 fimbrial protein [Serratia marcescens]MDZ7427779.1 fimbrial protein [Serratia marcescens]MDZ7485798.1 fimbrial protein [Serratia marcescens]MDZ7524889.1 fimbrial protein [Serratia marcescens]
MKRQNKAGRLWMGVLLCAAALPAQPAATLNVSVTVLAPLPCVVNGSKPIDVDFGPDVMTTRIDGNNYRTPIDYTLTCNEPANNAMRLQIVGAVAGFDSRLLQTDVDGLGIALLRDGVRLAPNTWQNFTFPTLPKLEAVPMKQAAATLRTGDFSAAATLRVDYQ